MTIQLKMASKVKADRVKHENTLVNFQDVINLMAKNII